jgi:hypothetical protein
VAALTGAAVVAAWRAEWERMGFVLFQGLPPHIAADLETRIDNALLDAMTHSGSARDPIPEDGQRGGNATVPDRRLQHPRRT